MYMHMSKVAATEGAAVQKGDVVGYVGSTGRSTAPHLHWSLYVNGGTVNPRDWGQAAACPAAKKAPAKSPNSGGGRGRPREPRPHRTRLAPAARVLWPEAE